MKHPALESAREVMRDVIDAGCENGCLAFLPDGEYDDKQCDCICGKARAALLALDAAMAKGEILSAVYKGDRLAKTEHSAIICHEDTAGVLPLEDGESIRRVLVLPMEGE